MPVKLIADNITNLTDARYFAAMGVDVLCYDIRPDTGIDLQQVAGLAEWVEGPKSGLDTRGCSTELTSRAIEVIEPAFLVLDLYAEVPEGYSGKVARPWYDGVEYTELIRSSHVIYVAGASQSETVLALADRILESSPGKGIWIDVNAVVDYLPQVIGYPGIEGLVVHGGDEEITGVKAYGDLDDLIELIRS